MAVTTQTEIPLELKKSASSVTGGALPVGSGQKFAPRIATFRALTALNRRCGFRTT